MSTPSSPMAGVSPKSRTGKEAQDAAFSALGDAVLELLDKSLPEAVVEGEADGVSSQIRIRASEIVATLRCHVLDEIERIMRSKLGAMLAKEKDLTAELGAERQKCASLQTQMKVMKDTVDRLNKAHGEDLRSKEAEFADKLRLEKDAWGREQEAAVANAVARANAEAQQKSKGAANAALREQLGQAEAALKRTLEEQVQLLRRLAAAWQGTDAGASKDNQAKTPTETGSPTIKAKFGESTPGTEGPNVLQQKLDGLDKHRSAMDAKRARG